MKQGTRRESPVEMCNVQVAETYEPQNRNASVRITL